MSITQKRATETGACSYDITGNDDTPSVMRTHGNSHNNTKRHSRRTTISKQERTDIPTTPLSSPRRKVRTGQEPVASVNFLKLPHHNDTPCKTTSGSLRDDKCGDDCDFGEDEDEDDSEVDLLDDSTTEIFPRGPLHVTPATVTPSHGGNRINLNLNGVANIDHDSSKSLLSNNKSRATEPFRQHTTSSGKLPGKRIKCKGLRRSQTTSSRSLVHDLTDPSSAILIQNKERKDMSKPIVVTPSSIDTRSSARRNSKFTKGRSCERDRTLKDSLQTVVSTNERRHVAKEIHSIVVPSSPYPPHKPNKSLKLSHSQQKRRSFENNLLLQERTPAFFVPKDVLHDQATNPVVANDTPTKANQFIQRHYREQPSKPIARGNTSSSHLSVEGGSELLEDCHTKVEQKNSIPLSSSSPLPSQVHAPTKDVEDDTNWWSFSGPFPSVENGLLGDNATENLCNRNSNLQRHVIGTISDKMTSNQGNVLTHDVTTRNRGDAPTHDVTTSILVQKHMHKIEKNKNNGGMVNDDTDDKAKQMRVSKTNKQLDEGCSHLVIEEDENISFGSLSVSIVSVTRISSNSSTSNRYPYLSRPLSQQCSDMVKEETKEKGKNMSLSPPDVGSVVTNQSYREGEPTPLRSVIAIRDNPENDKQYKVAEPRLFNELSIVSKDFDLSVVLLELLELQRQIDALQEEAARAIATTQNELEYYSRECEMWKMQYLGQECRHQQEKEILLGAENEYRSTSTEAIAALQTCYKEVWYENRRLLEELQVAKTQLLDERLESGRLIKKLQHEIQSIWSEKLILEQRVQEADEENNCLREKLQTSREELDITKLDLQRVLYNAEEEIKHWQKMSTDANDALEKRSVDQKRSEEEREVALADMNARLARSGEYVASLLDEVASVKKKLPIEQDKLIQKWNKKLREVECTYRPHRALVGFLRKCLVLREEPTFDLSETDDFNVEQDHSDTVVVPKSSSSNQGGVFGMDEFLEIKEKVSRLLKFIDEKDAFIFNAGRAAIEKKTRLKHLEQESSELRIHCAQNAEELDRKEKEVSLQAQGMAQNEKQESLLNEWVSGKAMENKKTMSELSVLKQQLSSALNSMDWLTNENAQLQQKLANSEARNCSTCEDYEKKCRDFQDEIDKILDLQQIVEAALSHDVIVLQRQVEELSEKNHRSNGVILELEQESTQHAMSIATERAKAQKAEQQFLSQTNQILDLEEDAHFRVEIIEKQQHMIQTLNNSLSSKRSTVAKLKSLCHGLRQRLATSENNAIAIDAMETNFFEAVRRYNAIIETYDIAKVENECTIESLRLQLAETKSALTNAMKVG